MTVTPQVHQRQLGKNGPMVSAMGLGCMGLTAFYSTSNTEKGNTTNEMLIPDNLALLDHAVDAGCTFLDTADIYTTNEDLLKSFLARRRDQVFLCTKFGFLFDPQDCSKFNKPSFSVCGKREYVLHACERSLRRLGVDTIDLYYLHRVDNDTPIEETVGAMAELVQQGKVRYIGLSECSAATLRRAHAVHPISAVQMEYSPWSLDIEHNDLLATARELGVAIVAYSPLGRGFLAGKFQKPEDLPLDDWRRSNPRFQGDNFYTNLEIVKQFQDMACKKECTASQLVLAWVMAQGSDIIPIPGTTKIKYLDENLASMNIVLTKQEQEAIRAIVNKVGVQGTRYPETMNSTLNR